MILSIFIEFWDLNSEEYKLKPVDSITYNYKILNKTSEITQSKIISHKSITGDKKNHLVLVVLLSYLLQWIGVNGGKYKYISDNYVLVFKPKSTLVSHIQIFDNYHTVELRDMKIKKNNNILVSFTDKINDKDNLGTFTRTIKNQEYIYIDSDLKIKKLLERPLF
jgi:hypothetical protein